MERRLDTDHLLGAITRGEAVLAEARASDARLVVTERRIAVASDDRVLLDLELEGLRRVQFDTERDRPATLVVVPDLPRHRAQVLEVEPGEYPEVAEVLVLIGQRLASRGTDQAGPAHAYWRRAGGCPAPRRGVVVEMGESRTPRPEPFAWIHYERVR